MNVMNSKNWKWVAIIGSMMVAKGLRNGVGTGYKKLTGKEPPENPAEKGVKIKDAILWTMLVSIVGGVGKLLFNTAIAYKWKHNAVKPNEI